MVEPMAFYSPPLIQTIKEEIPKVNQLWYTDSGGAFQRIYGSTSRDFRRRDPHPSEGHLHWIPEYGIKDPSKTQLE
jgi:hypothetical protein